MPRSMRAGARRQSPTEGPPLPHPGPKSALAPIPSLSLSLDLHVPNRLPSHFPSRCPSRFPLLLPSRLLTLILAFAPTSTPSPILLTRHSTAEEELAHVAGGLRALLAEHSDALHVRHIPCVHMNIPPSAACPPYPMSMSMCVTKYDRAQRRLHGCILITPTSQHRLPSPPPTQLARRLVGRLASATRTRRGRRARAAAASHKPSRYR